MTDEPDDVAPDAPSGPPEKMGLAFYGALVLIGFLVLMVVFLNYPASKASAGTVLTHTNWTLQYYTDRTGILIPGLSGTAVTTRFGSDGSLSGSAGCNHYSGRYSTSDYTINISETVSTLVYCPGAGIMDQEAAYLADLPRASSFRVDESSLRVYDSAGKPLLIFVPA